MEFVSSGKAGLIYRDWMVWVAWNLMKNEPSRRMPWPSRPLKRLGEGHVNLKTETGLIGRKWRQEDNKTLVLVPI